MNPDELFDKFPELLFGSLRKQMLTGIISAETVDAVLSPFLEDYWEVMPLLSPELQSEFENILRIYPDVAARYGLKMKPPFSKGFSLLAETLRKFENGSGLDYPDLAAEEQKLLSGAPVVAEGQGIFVTDSGNSVYLDFCLRQGESEILFTRRPAETEAEIFLPCGLSLAFPRGLSEKKVGVRVFLDCSRGKGPAEDRVRIIEKERRRPELKK